MPADSLKQRLLRNIRGSVTLTTAAFLVDNLLATMKVTRPDPAPDEHLAGADMDADIAYARKVAAMYLAAAPNIGGTVAELGPGGNAATGLLLLERGCTRIDLVDRFAFAHDQARLNAMYRRMIDASPALSSRIGTPSDLSPHVEAYVGEQAAAEVFFDSHRGYDAITSCAVLEHLYDPLQALESMTEALNPGGVLLHQVDLRDHGMFTAGGHHELTFLTLPGWLYPHLTRRRGRPNRILLPRYREALSRLPLETELKVTHLVGVGEIDPSPYQQIPAPVRERAEAEVERIRPRLAREFANLPASDLAVAGFFLRGRKLGEDQCRDPQEDRPRSCAGTN